MFAAWAATQAVEATALTNRHIALTTTRGDWGHHSGGKSIFAAWTHEEEQRREPGRGEDLRRERKRRTRVSADTYREVHLLSAVFWRP